MNRRFSATPYLFLAPALALIAIFVLFPIAAVVFYSFTDWDIVRPPVWSGLDNYQRLVGDPTFWKALTHSIVYLLVTPTIIALSIGLAIAVNRKLRGMHIFRALYFVPAVSGSIAIGICWRWLFDRNGFINSVLISAGVIKVPIQWLSEPGLVLPIAMLLTIWAGIGYYAVIFLAGLQNIPEELYDAARIDGCNDLQKHWHVEPARPPSPDRVRRRDLEPGGAQGLRRDLRPDQPDGGHPRLRGDRGVLSLETGLRERARGLRRSDRDGPAGPDARLLDRQRALPRARHGARVMAVVAAAAAEQVGRRRRARGRRVAETVFWYLVLGAMALITAFPFAWILLTSLKGPKDLLFSTPPQFLPNDPTLANYGRVLEALPIPAFFFNSIVVAIALTTLNVLVTALAAYPLAKMRFRGRDAIFYLLLATLIVPAQLTFIPSYLLAQFFGYYNSLPAVILPGLASAFNIFLMRQAFKGVPGELIDAARVDGARDWRIWWQIAVPLVRPTIATVAILTFVTSWNDFLWPSLMLPTMTNKTLPVGLAALQGFFASDFRGIAAGVTMTVVPILVFFIALQRYFVRGLTGAVKG